MSADVHAVVFIFYGFRDTADGIAFFKNGDGIILWGTLEQLIGCGQPCRPCTNNDYIFHDGNTFLNLIDVF